MLIDLHTHTFPNSDDSFLKPEELFRHAKAAGLDGVCLTDHDTFWDPATLERWSREYELVILPGCEITTEEGHLLAFGLERYLFGMHRASFVRREADALGAALVAAHPYRRVFSPQDHREPHVYQARVETVATWPLWQMVEAIEVLNGRGTPQENGFSRDLARRLGKPAVATGDCHKTTDVGVCATRFSRPIRNVRDLIAELKAGRCEPVALRSAAPVKPPQPATGAR